MLWNSEPREQEAEMPKPPGEAAARDQPSLTTGKAAPPLTEMLGRWKAGDQHALAELMPVVYDELRRAARRRLRRERPDHTFQSAALVNEMYMRMLVQKPFGTENRLHFFMVASRLMRQILVDHARSHRASKRGAEHNCRLDTSIVLPAKQSVDVVAVNDALNSLARFDEQQARIVEMRFFGGLAMEEVAEVLEISLSTAKRDWSVAKAWLTRELNRGSHDISRPVATD
jgi:RNA polymerase sigma factor (TIGR02999 family)